MPTGPLDGPGWPNYTAAQIRECEEKLEELAPKYGDGNSRGLQGAVEDGVITAEEREWLRTFIAWENA